MGVIISSYTGSVKSVTQLHDTKLWIFINSGDTAINDTHQNCVRKYVSMKL